jgi:succinate dehydrogenase (ubiquinone) cytochrome b560 subunit
MGKNISPHVNIYKFPVTALSSITTRLTGLYLSGLFIAGGIYQFTDQKETLYDRYMKLSDIPQRLFNYSIIFPITYHTYGGIRHFIWDKYPSLLVNKSVARSSYILFGGSIFTTIMYEKFCVKNKIN